MKLYLALSRAVYALTVITGMAFAVFCGYFALPGLSKSFGALAFCLAAFGVILMGYWSLDRRRRGQPMMPLPADHGDWMFVFFMNFMGSIANLLAFIIWVEVYDIYYVHPGRDVEGGPMVFFAMVATGAYILTLMMGEFGLTHGSQPRKSPDTGRAAELPGNTLESSAADDTPR